MASSGQTLSRQQLCAETLGQIALIQGMVSHIPDNRQILEFVCRGLEAVPGAGKITYRMVGAMPAEKRSQEKTVSRHFDLKFDGHLYAELMFNLSDETQFIPYVPYIENLSLMLGVIFEERRQRGLNEKYKAELEQLVRERTRQLEDEVRQHRGSQKLLDSIVNNTRNVIYVKDLQGRFTLVNDQFCKIFNLRRDQIIGHLPMDLFPGHIARQHADNDRRIISQKKTMTFDEHAELADGVHEYLSIKFPLMDEIGQVNAVGGISTDITEIKQTENALRLNEARLEALLTLFQMTDAHMDDVADFALEEAVRFTKSRIGYLAFTSDDESLLTMHSWSRASMQICGVKDKCVKYKLEETGLWGEAVRQRKPVITNDYPNAPPELKKGLPQGHIPLTRHMSVPVLDGERIVAVAGVGNKELDYDATDVRQLQLLMQGMWRLIQRMRADREKGELEKKLHQAYKMESIGTLAGGIAHDFNNILSAIFGYTEMSLMDTKQDSFVHSNLRSILEAAKRARDLVGHILTFSRQSERQPMPVEILPIVKEVGKFIRASLPTSIEIRQKLIGMPVVMADPTQIHQVIMNLCTNAGQAMQGGNGVLSIELETVTLDTEFTDRHPDLKPGVYVKLAISDTGHGMSAELIERIFDPFFTTKERGEGTGMGLAVVHGIVKQLGGAVTVYSHLGEGTAFNLFIPAIDRRSMDAPRAEKVVSKGSERVLFVDDEETLARLGETMLSSLGYQVTSVQSSTEALTLFESAPDQFDLVITDLAMPKMSGDQLARELLRIRADIPIILCTGFSASIDESRAKSMGIKAFVKKPILLRQIAETIREVLDG